LKFQITTHGLNEFIQQNVKTVKGDARVTFKQSVNDFYVVGACELCKFNGDCKEQKNWLRNIALFLKVPFLGCLKFEVTFEKGKK